MRASALSDNTTLSAIQQNRDPIGYTKRTRRYPVVKAPTTTVIASPGSFGSPDVCSPISGSVSESSVEQQREDDLLERLVHIERQCELLRRSNLDMKQSLLNAVLSPCIFNDHQFIERHTQTVRSQHLFGGAQHGSLLFSRYTAAPFYDQPQEKIFSSGTNAIGR